VTPATLHLVRGTANPNGAEDAQLFLLAGDPAAAPVTEIIPAEVGGQHSASLPPALADLEAQPFRLQILHFNDLHGQVSRATPCDEGVEAGRTEAERAGEPRPYISSAVFSRMVWRVRELRRRSRGDPRQSVLFVSGGDDLTGGILGELLGLRPAIHAAYRLYSAAGVDAGAVGNHDLDASKGGAALPQLAFAIEHDARFPLLSANLCASPLLAGQVHPAAILVVKGLRVGLVGLTTRAEVRHIPGLFPSHPLTAIQNLLPALRPLCDVVIVLSHLGHSLSATGAATRDAGDVELAASLPAGSVHLILGSHTHDALNEGHLGVANRVNGIPIVQAGAMGKFLGEVEITVGKDVSVSGVHLAPTADLLPDEGFEREQVQPLLTQVRPVLAQRLGRVADDPELTTEAVQAGFAAGELALANLIADALVAGCREAGHAVDLAAIDASSIQCGLPVGGALTFGDWFKLMPYADTVRLYRLTGQELAALLDDNARRADRPGARHVERGFLQFSSQVRYTIELGERRDKARAGQIMVDGQPLDQQGCRSFLMACTSFVREAAAPWERKVAVQQETAAPSDEVLPVLHSLGLPEADTGILVRDLLVAHLRAHGGATEGAGARRDGRLRFL
jgi:2',3'-cyclic-nucleotide 2'-phosphodiesterase (5'-nucleotidase family)